MFGPQASGCWMDWIELDWAEVGLVMKKHEIASKANRINERISLNSHLFDARKPGVINLPIIFPSRSKKERKSGYSIFL